jgi:hypothetical protein
LCARASVHAARARTRPARATANFFQKQTGDVIKYMLDFPVRVERLACAAAAATGGGAAWPVSCIVGPSSCGNAALWGVGRRGR